MLDRAAAPLVGTTIISSLLLWRWFGIAEARPVFLVSLLFGTAQALIAFTLHRKRWAKYVRKYFMIGVDEYSQDLLTRLFGDI